MACTVAFMDIKSASKAHNAELKLDDRTLNTEYYEPAAIPSATASPQNTPSPYATSPGNTRFPNGHGSDDHGTASFPDRCFYERSTSTSRLVVNSVSSTAASIATISETPEFVGAGRVSTRGTSAAAATVLPPTAYHGDSTAPASAPSAVSGRSRERTASYRNGPYGSSTPVAVLDARHPTTRTPAWGYNSTGTNQTDTGYNSTTTENNERRNSDQSIKKKTKSKSGSRSPSPSGTTSSRSHSRSRSRSSSSSSSSSMSRDTSSTGSPKSKRLTSGGASNHQPVVHSDDRRPLAICVKNLPVRSSDTSLKDGLFHEYKKHGKVTWVKVVGKDAERHAIVCFKKPEDVEKALEVSYDKLFFGCKIEVAPYQGYDVEDNDLRPYEAEIDEYHPRATRTLFIGNLEKDVTASDLRKHFDQFGEIIEIDIKKQGAVSSYAFCQYSDIVSVVKAIRKMDGEHLGNNRIKLGFGKSMPYNCVWIDGINENVNEKYLKMQFEPFGVISKLHIDREKSQALIFYDQVMSAQTAVTKMRGFTLKTTKIQVDFASRECQESFFERIEKQTTIIDRTVFEERREATTRTFETVTTRFSRYDTPTRPRTSSYSSRSNASASQVTSLQSPGTPGSVTPRGSRSRARFPDYYDQTLEYADRHFRSYDEYSQSSTASHEDLYDHEYGFVHDVGDPLQVIDNVVPFAPPDMRNLQKERVHLLEQLEECPSSGDELISPKKRIKLDILDTVITSDVIIEANRDHRKVMEVRRLSDVNLKHHSRRPSIDSGKHVRHEVVYVPHSVCKRRKTAGSDSGSKIHHYDHSGSESIGGSRPGTPLCDERPENLQPSEPRRVPREREGPLTLPLPRFASQIMNRGPVSVAGIKGQKDNILSSPPPAVTSPRISNPRPPSPVHVPPPASPPPRPPSLSSNSSDSDITPPSPSLEERIKSLDEKYEKWSGSRALSAAGGDALALIDANLEKFRQRHKILDLDLKEVQPSEIVKSVMAKRSVFDEDLKRLENVGEKYEPKDFSFFPRSTLTTPTAAPVIPVQVPPALKINTVLPQPKTPVLLSPRSTGTSIQAAKGLQYPFPTHPPNLILSSTTSSVPQTPPTTTVTTTPQISTATTVTTVSDTPGDNKLKPCSSDRTPSKIIVNKTNVVSVKISVNIPNAIETKSRRDSTGSSSSPRADIKTRRNSDTSARKSDDNDIERKERAQSEERKRERIEKIKIENEKLEKEKSERERIEKERHEHEKQEKLRLEKERLEKERLERESELEKQRLEKERLEKQKLEKERLEKLKLEKERVEKHRLEKERLEREKMEKLERERVEKERVEKERVEREKVEKERVEREKVERENIEKERVEREKVEKERLEKEKSEKEKSEKEKSEKEKSEKEKSEKEKSENEKSEKDRSEKEKSEKERSEKEGSEKERSEKERSEKERSEKERSEKERSEKERSEKERSEKERSEKERSEKERSEKERLERERLGKERLEKEQQIKLDLEKARKEDLDKLHHEQTDKIKKEKEESDRRHKDDEKPDKHDREKVRHKEDSDKRHLFDNKNAKENNKDVNHISTKDSHESRKLNVDRDSERRKESIKENRDNNIHEKHKHIRDIVETRHMSIDTKSIDPSKRKERNNSLPSSIGSKRRFSSHETIESEENKKVKLSHSERRDSKDSTRSDKSSKHRNNNKSYSEEKRKEREERHKKHKLEKQKSKREKETLIISLNDKEFLNRLELKSTNDEKKQISKSRSDPESCPRTSEEKKKRERIRKLTNSSDSDSDEPKKHSIFDIVDDEPAYISMYDKVKARSCKNMAKLEEEKRQEQLKAKFSQLKQSRAKREEKKRSTSWDEDSDSDKDLSDIKVKRCPKILIDSSDDEVDHKSIKTDSDSSLILKHIKQEVLDISEDEADNKNLILKAIKPRITSDTSEDERNKKKLIKEEFFPEENKSYLFDEIKKERRNSETEKYNNKHSFIDITTDEETHEKKERSERREKKHKKKQKKQKHSVSSEESTIPSENQEKPKHEKKKEHSKKEKRRDKNREKSKKSKKKREGKMENIFGSLSEDSDKEIELPNSVENEEHKDKSEREREKEEREREKEEHKRKKEKKRREKERRMQEATAAITEEVSNENSMDYIDMGKQLEANMLKDEGFDVPETKKEEPNMEEKKEKEIKEKKKKRKKSKDEKSKHHNHHHDKNRVKTSEIKPIELTPTIPQNPSLPNIIDESPEIAISPVNPIISPIPKTPSTSQEKKREKFGTQINETAIKSICEFDSSVKKEEAKDEDENKEKPRVVISQEETEDAVAALLGESFGSGKQEEFYNDDNSIGDPPSSSNVQDDEEMRQAVQSLSAADLDVKPDTPQSEHDLQIDTDTEEQEDVPLRFDSTPKTPEVNELPKTPDLPPYFNNSVDEKQVKAAQNIGSPPSLTPIRSSANINEVRKVIDMDKIVDVAHTSVIKIDTKKTDSVPKIVEPQYPPLKPLSKPDHAGDVSNKILVNPPQLHNLPARSPVQINKATGDSTLLSPRLSSAMIHNRMPITSVMVPKPIQSTTVILQQSKIAHSLEPPKLVATSDPRTQERPRMIFPTSTIQQPQYSNFGPNKIVRHMPPQGLLIPSRNYNFMGNASYNENNPHIPLPQIPIPKEAKPSTSIGSQFPSICINPQSSPKPAAAMSPKPVPEVMSPKQVPAAMSTNSTPAVLNQPISQPQPIQTALSQPISSPQPIQKVINQSIPTALSQPKAAALSQPKAAVLSQPIPTPQPIQTVVSQISTTLIQPKAAVMSQPIPTTQPIQTVLSQSIPTTRPIQTVLSQLIPTTRPIQTVLSQSIPTTRPIQTVLSQSIPTTRPIQTVLSQAIPTATSQQKAAVLSQPKAAALSLPKSAVLNHPIPTPQPIQAVLSQTILTTINQPTAAVMSPAVSSQTIPTSQQIQTVLSQTISTTLNQPKAAVLSQPIPAPQPIQTVLNRSMPTALIQPKPVVLSPSIPSTLSQTIPSVMSQPITSILNPSLPISQPMQTLSTQPITTASSQPKPSVSNQPIPVSRPIQTVMCQSTSAVLNQTVLVTEKQSITTVTTLSHPIASVSNESILTTSVYKQPIITAVPAVSSLKPSDTVVPASKPEPKNMLTSTPSPVIVSAPPVKTEPDKKEEEKPIKLAIEAVTDELNMSLEKFSPEVKGEKIAPESKTKEEPVVEKTETESIVSDISKESSDILAKDDPLDTKEDSDYWSAKEAIDSVLKTLVSPDELSETSESGKFGWFNDSKSPEKSSPEKDEPDSNEDTKDPPTLRSSSRRGGRGRGRGKPLQRPTNSVERGGIQTRRGKLKELTQPTPLVSKRGRGGKPRTERKSSKSESEPPPTDVYEFRDEPDDANKEQRPRLILTIKSPAILNSNNSQTTAVVKEVTKDGAKELKSPDNREEFVSPSTNTRKSRRLQERDTSKNTVDDTIEDVVKNTIQTRAAANQKKSGKQTPKQSPETPRKSPRGKKGRRGSETSSSEETPKEEIKVETPKELEKSIEIEKTPEPTKEKPHEGLKATVLRRIKGELNEPTIIIDPVTGELIPMRESEEGKYVPLPGTPNKVPPKKLEEPEPNITKTQPTVIAQPQQVTVVQQPKPQTLKAHVLSSQVAVVQPKTVPSIVVVSKPSQETALTKPTPIVITKSITPIVATKPSTPVVVTKAVTPISQHLTINTNLGLSMNKMVKAPVLSPILMTQKQQMMQVSKQQVSKAHLTSPLVSQAQMINTQIAHMKHQPIIKQQVMAKGPLKPLHPQQIINVAISSPPATKSQSGRMIQTSPAGAKGIMDPPKVDVSMGNVMMGQRPKLSPQGPQQRIIGQTGLPLPGYEPNLHGERSFLNRSRSPPPAHQNSPSPKGEAIAHFPPGPLRPPEINPSHYMHPSHVMQYQQYLRQQQLQHFSRSGGMEKVGDGQEGEEAPVTSPPLELRRPGSVGLALTGRSTAIVPHSLHSPHDRTTDSPQIGQVYNVHTPARIPYHHPNRYYDQAEPPPAHRPLTSHGSLAALGSDRGLAHMAPIGTPDRPLSSHSALSAHMGNLGSTDRPMSNHIERPVSAHGLMSTGLGAAGNLMGAVARHIGAEAPTSQRGLQAATPPHASQVPPQAESLLMLLKQYPCMWQGLLALKNDQAAVQMYFVSGNDDVAKCSLPKNTDGSTPPLRIFQRMRLEPPQVEGVARKMQMENEHCMLLALPCGHDHMDVLKQSHNLTNGFITYLQQKQAAGIVNVAAPGTTQPPAYVVHIFPSCDFVNENLRRIAPSLLERVADIAHLLIVITTV